MDQYRFTPQALDDLFRIWIYIDQDNREAANRVEDAVFRACELIAKSPLAGQVREDLTALPLRFWVVQPYSSYLIVYEPTIHPIQIIRILHGARDVSSILT